MPSGRVEHADLNQQESVLVFDAAKLKMVEIRDGGKNNSSTYMIANTFFL